MGENALKNDTNHQTLKPANDIKKKHTQVTKDKKATPTSRSPPKTKPKRATASPGTKCSNNDLATPNPPTILIPKTSNNAINQSNKDTTNTESKYAQNLN